MTDAPAVACSGLAKRYGRGEAEVHALRGVDLEARRGELLMLMGPSGCGKTTLLSVVAGILDPDGGACRVFGQDLAVLSPSARARFRAASVGFVFQSLNLLPPLSAAENVSVPLLLRGTPRREALGRARKLLAAVGLAGREEALPAELSGGQQQRVAVARALVHRPGLVVCDEPTSALDHETGAQVMRLLKTLAREAGATVLVVSHDPRIAEFADRIATMDDGRITSLKESLS